MVEWKESGLETFSTIAPWLTATCVARTIASAISLPASSNAVAAWLSSLIRESVDGNFTEVAASIAAAPLTNSGLGVLGHKGHCLIGKGLLILNATFRLSHVDGGESLGLLESSWLASHSREFWNAGVEVGVVERAVSVGEGE